MSIVQPGNSQNARSNTERNSGDKEDGKRKPLFNCLKNPDVIIAMATVVMVIVAIFQVVYLGEANKVAGHAADAATQSVELARDTAQKQLRAYVSAINGEVVGIRDNGSMQVRITIRNAGQTPAREVSVERSMYWKEVGPPKPQAMQIKEKTRAVLASGQEVSFEDGPEHEIDASYREKLRDKVLALHVWGTIRYKDIYDTDHESKFHFVQGGTYDPRALQMGLADDGNTMD